MKITIVGAAGGEVTGSVYYVQTKRACVLVDCGLFQGGKKSEALNGEKVAVKANVHTLGGFSAHAGQKDLLTWFSAIAPSKPRVILTHGEDRQRQALAKKIQQLHRLNCHLPAMQETIEL